MDNYLSLAWNFQAKGMVRKTALIFIFFVFALTSYGQNTGYFQIDSLKKELINTPDAERAEIYNKLIWKLRNTDPDAAIAFGQDAVKNAKRYHKYKELSKAYSFLGVAYRNKGDFTQALEYYHFGLDIAEKHDYKEQIGYGHINIGNWELYNESTSDAIIHLEKAIEIAKEIENKRMLAYCQLNLGRVYLLEHHTEKAENLIQKALDYRIESNNLPGQAVCYKYLADVYRAKGDNKKALEQYKKSFEIIDPKFDKDLLADLYTQVANIYMENNNLTKAGENAKMALEVALEAKNPVRIRAAYQIQVDIAKQKGQLKQALMYYEYVKNYNDSFYLNQLKEKKSIAKFDLERERQKAKLDSINIVTANAAKSLKEERRMNFALRALLIFSTLLLIILYFVNRQRKKMYQILEEQKFEIEAINADLNAKNEEILTQSEEIEQQRDAIERQQIKITDSIVYAKRIQDAALPDENYLHEILPKHFVLFLPRDIVSGDFYWARKIENKIFVTVADSTGHGVPGAFVSMLGMSLLNEIIIKDKTWEANKVLDKLRVLIKKQLKQSPDKESQDDGMDMALCIIDTETLEMQYSGANNPAYLIRNGELIILKPSLNPVGIYFRELPFNKKVVQLQKGDVIYLFSDGYADQFGGKTGRRYMSKRMRNLLLKIQNRPFAAQKNILKQKINEWRGSYRQIDDITVMGIKIDEL